MTGARTHPADDPPSSAVPPPAPRSPASAGLQPPAPRSEHHGGGPPRWQRIAAAAVAGLLVTASFPPLDLGPLILVALIPLLWAWRGARPGTAALAGFVCGCTWFGGTVSWAWYFGAVAFVPLTAALAAYLALGGAAVGVLARRGVRGPWVAAAVITLAEALRGRVPFGGFAWAEVGVALHDIPVARDLASWGGVPLVTFLVVAWNRLLLEAILAGPARDGRALRYAGTGMAAVLVVSTAMVLGRVEPTVTGHLRFALVQGNDKNRDLTQAEIDARFLSESHLSLAEEGLHGPYDLIVFPESSMDVDPETDPELRARIVAVAAAHDADVIVNAVTEKNGNTYNTNFLYEPDGTLQGTYSKQHLVPFGEYVPGRSLLGFVDELQQVPIDYTPGTTRTIFDVKGHAVGSVICFESAFGPLVRDFVRDGAELIVVTTNNRSYRRSANSAQHVAWSQMRAAETARPVLHASISGITAVIDAHGNLRSETQLFRNAVVPGVTDTTTGETPYVRFGSWVPLAGVAGLAIALLAVSPTGRRLRRRRPNRRSL